VAEKILARTVESCRARGVAYIPVVTPFEATFGTMWDEFSRSLPAGHKVDPGYPDRRLAALFERLGTPAVLLRDAFTREESKVRPYIDGHLNSEGHRVVAESLAREIVARGLLQR
jgi:hypothetical protein